MTGGDVENKSLDWRVINNQLQQEQRLQLKQYRLEDEIESTNEMALNVFCKTGSLPAVCFAEKQSCGRGRNGRNWVSPRSQNIYMSLAWQFNLSIVELQSLSLAVGVVVAELMGSYGVGASVKWPNDVLVKGKKLAGVLLESHIKTVGKINLVIGVGLNVSMSDSSVEAIDQPWTDMAAEVKALQIIDRSKLAGELLAAVMTLCSNYEKTGFHPYRKKWLNFDICVDSEVRIVADNVVYNGLCTGIDSQGALRVIIDGSEKVFYAADVNVRLTAN